MPRWYESLSSFHRSHREALESLTRAESAAESDPRAPYAGILIFARLGRTEEARRAAQRALEIEPRMPAARELLRSLP